MPIPTLPAWIPDAVAAWLPVLLAALLALGLAHIGFRVGLRLVRHAVAGTPRARTVVDAARRAAHTALPLLALNVVLQGAPADLPGLVSLQRLVGMALIGAVTWLVASCIHGLARAVIEAHPITVTDNLGARRIHTQTRMLSRTGVGIVVLVGTSLMLMVLPGVRQVGTSLLASAGLVGIVAGFAARPVLGNMIAGLQIGLTQPIRIDDVVIVENEWGVIEEITSSYVVVRIWDQRRLVVPLTYWVEKPFQNWTRASAELTGTVFLWVDYRMPLAPLREALHRTCEGTPLWDRRHCGLQVVEAGSHAVQLRCLVTAADASRAWDLRCHVREQLIDFMQREYPQYLPRQRAALISEAGPAAA